MNYERPSLRCGASYRACSGNRECGTPTRAAAESDFLHGLIIRAYSPLTMNWSQTFGPSLIRPGRWWQLAFKPATERSLRIAVRHH
ncbi:hypothetical protein PoB_005879800 [Plakobranchus ocellatus]|uniref:Uncharacterized protein n=1 Tax=Plakobranchus ocellatus TaxID=259542 RepID=A0AAV4CM26_9GAST|nr:hypothetical protein PoB_005879800 [Plakobranchus ocellatus]